MVVAGWLRESAWVGVLAFGCSAGGCASGPARPAAGVTRGDTSFLEKRLRYEVEEAMDDEQIQSIAISVVDEKGPLYEHAFGLANVEAHWAATVDTPYRWGSNSKLFVMLSLLQLEAQGKVELDAPLVKYLPEFTIGPPPPQHPESASWKLTDITLRNMLTHHSGLPNDVLVGFLSEHPLSLGQLEHQVSTMHAHFPAGLVHSYSNLAYALLGLVVERVSGQSFDAYVKEHLFAPIGMPGASFAWTPALEAFVAQPYDARGKVRPMYELSTSPAGSLIASTREMGAFATALLRDGRGAHGRFVDADLYRSTYRRQNGDVPLDFDAKQGLTWRLDTRSVERFGHSAEHGGGILSHHSAFVLLTDYKLGVAAVTNSERGAASVHRLAERALELALEVKTGKPTPPRAEPPEVHPSDRIDPRRLDAWVGDYATVLGHVRIVREGDELGFDLFDREFFLRPLREGGMGIWTELWGFWDTQPGDLSRQRFSLVEVKGRKVGVQEGPLGRRLLGVAYQPVPAPAEWRARVGHYRLVPRPGDYQFIEGLQLSVAPDGQLLMRPIPTSPNEPLPPSAALRPLDSTTAVSEGLGRNRGLFVTVDENGKLHHLGLVFERVTEGRPERAGGRPRRFYRGHGP